MKPSEFVKAYYPFARESESKTGILAVFTLAQAAIESDWSKKAIGNMFFGIKDTDGLNGNEQKLMTTEYSTRANCKPSEVGLIDIVSIEPVMYKGVRQYKYKGHGWFRKYSSPEESFTDHVKFFNENKRYKEALKVKNDPVAFSDAIAKAGYASGPAYATLLKSVIKMIQKELEK